MTGISDIFIYRRYFTAWSWIFFILFPAHPMNLINSVICSLGGFYITYIYPRFLYVPYLRRRVHGTELMILDVVTHHSLFVYQMMMYRHRFQYPIIRLVKLHFLFVVYMMTCFDLKNYSFRPIDILQMLILYIAIWVFIRTIG